MWQGLKGQNNWENAMFNSLLHLNWKKKKKTNGGSEKQSWKCKRAAALGITW